MPLFEVAVIEKTTKKESEYGKTERLIFGPIPVIAKDPQAAALVAVLDGQREKLTGAYPAKLEVLVRPFSGPTQEKHLDEYRKSSESWKDKTATDHWCPQITSGSAWIANSTTTNTCGSAQVSSFSMSELTSKS